MKLLILTNNYPREGALYSNGFVHRRAKNYISKGYEVEVFFFTKQLESAKYCYDHVPVHLGSGEELNGVINSFLPDKILVHFLTSHMMKVLTKITNKIPVIVWIHGVEALSWYRRLFNFNGLPFLRYIADNINQMYCLRRFIQNNKSVKYVFVSKWMKEITEIDTFSKIPSLEIIPNVVDTSIFSFQEKVAEDRKKILLIRPFISKKYANDIAVKAILELSKKVFFKELEFTIYGEGKYFNKVLKPIMSFSNVQINEIFLTQEGIKIQHQKHGLFLCPTRQDAQGVSMCEAMSSGLVPLTSNNTAIPEFVEDGKSGFLTNGSKDIADKIEKLYYDSNLFLKMSKEASKSVQQKCHPDVVISEELRVINS